MMMMTALSMGLNHMIVNQREKDGSNGAGEIWREKRYVKLGWGQLGSK